MFSAELRCHLYLSKTSILEYFNTEKADIGKLSFDAFSINQDTKTVTIATSTEEACFT